MQIYVNGGPYAAEAKITLADLLQQLNLVDKRVAIELNQNIIPRSQHAGTFLQEGDAIEIIHAIAGG